MTSPLEQRIATEIEKLEPMFISMTGQNDDIRKLLHASLLDVARASLEATKLEEVAEGINFEDGKLPPADVMTEMMRDIEHVRKGYEAAISAQKSLAQKFIGEGEDKK